MKKKLLLFILILIIPVFAWASGRVVFMAPGGSTCSTAIDTELDGYDAGSSGYSTYLVRAVKFTLSSQSDITEYVLNMCDSGQAGTITLAIYTHNSGDDEPDTIIAGTSKQLAHGDVADCGALVGTTFTLDTIKEDLPSGTYWLVAEWESGTCRYEYHSSATGERMCYDEYANGNWTCQSDNALLFSVYGCE